MENNEVFFQMPVLPRMELAVGETANRIFDFFQIDPSRRPNLVDRLAQTILSVISSRQSEEPMVYLKIVIDGERVEVTDQAFGPTH